MDYEQRVWGYCHVLHTDDYCKIKILFIYIDKNISYQYHRNREEHWTIVQGKGKFVSEGRTKYLMQGDKVQIDRNEKHTIKNVGDEILIIHEVQLGDSCEETDIVRVECSYKI